MNKRLKKTKQSAASPWKTFHVRPEDEHSGPEHYYSAGEAVRYAESNAMRKIQRELTLRALELARIPLEAKVLDAGCGTGFSLEVLREVGYDQIAGFDAVDDLLKHAVAKGFEAKKGDLRKIPFSANSFDAIVSISVLQWILVSNAEANLQKAANEFWRVLRKGGSAIVQFYPRSEAEAVAAGKAFLAAGFVGKLIIDNPENARKRKVFLLLKKA